MHEWALLRSGWIVKVITTAQTRSQVSKRYPMYQVVDIYTLPSHVQDAYPFWRQRP